MKKFCFGIFLFLLGACATAEYKNGTEVFKISRPIFSATSGSITKADGTTINISASSSVSVDALASMAFQSYAKYMSGGLVNTPNPTMGPLITEKNK